MGLKVIILGAGKGFSGLDEKSGHPKAIHQITHDKRVLDILIENFQKEGANSFVFVGGYQVNKVISAYPNMKHYFNPNWEDTNMLKSLYLTREELDGEVLICYADTLHSSDVISDLIQSQGDIVLSEDNNWLNRYEGRGDNLIHYAEKIVSEQNTLVEIGGEDILAEKATGEFTGLIYLKGQGTEVFKECLAKYHREDAQFVDSQNIVAFIAKLLEQNIVVNTCLTHGAWAELEAPQDIAQFVFGTKAETLNRLHKRLTKSKIEDQVSFTLKDWEHNQDDCLNQVQDVFDSGQVVVRSSAIGEDSFETSNAGEFLSLLNVNVQNQDEVRSSVGQVFNSYHNTNPDHQCLIQPQLLNVSMSGVVFTRDLETGAPYYIVNYDISDKTDTITSGTSVTSKTAIYYKNSQVQFKEEFFNELIEVLREIEEVVGHDSLDIEFAKTNEGIHILQVRPIVANRKNKVLADVAFEDEIEAVKESVRYYINSDRLGTQKSVLANMPDWNPAEIIGVAPKPLALSLYQYLITDEIWRVQRTDYGYRDSFPSPLVISLSGQPYIDTKASFNSFIPSSLEDETAAKLLDFYLTKLRNHPELHDKVEFEIVYTCFSFDLRNRLDELFDFGFSEKEIEHVFDSIRNQTKEIISPANGLTEKAIERIENLKIKRRSRSNEAAGVIEKGNAVFELLEECKVNGTLPFAKLARSAFIATDLLKSLVRLNVLSQNEYNTFFNSLETVASHFSESLNKLRAKQLTLDQFLKEFGHLRPGTYDITSNRYDETPDKYFPSETCETKLVEEQVIFELSPEQNESIKNLIEENGLGVEVEQLFDFIRTTIIHRESSKFEFTKNLSDSFVIINEIGEELGLTAEDMSFVSIGEILQLRKSYNGKSVLKEDLLELINKNKFRYRLTRSLKLPHLISKVEDIELFWLEEGKPNFITEKNVTDELVYLSVNNHSDEDITDKIVLIDSADPGYDWIFGYAIKGLITMYGGANSHMAIRAAEFGLPAAIGCGEKIGEKLKKANTVELNCINRLIQIIS